MDSISDPSQFFNSLSDAEKAEVLKELLKNVKKIECEKCKKPRNLKYCVNCIRQYLIGRFDIWSSNKKEIDELIKTCQKNAVRPDSIVEWISHNSLQDIQYIIEGGFYKIYKAIWKEGRFATWDFEQQKLKRYGAHSVTIKYLTASPESGQGFREIQSHLTLSSELSPVILSYGLAKDPDNNNFVIIMEDFEYDLKTYLQENISSLTWLKKYDILLNILKSLECVHNKDLIHADLNSGNIMFSKRSESWSIGDFRSCRNVDSPGDSYFGIMSHMAPEILKRQKPTKCSDIYSFAMIMSEISSGHRPFSDIRPNKELSTDIIENNKRPDIMDGTPTHYSNLMKKCWDNDPSERPTATGIISEITKFLSELALEEKKKLQNINCFKVHFVPFEGRKVIDSEVKPNAGYKNPPIEEIRQDQICGEEVPDGIGIISTAMLSLNNETCKVAVKSLQIDKSNGSKNLSFLTLLKNQINERRDRIYGHDNILEFLGIGIKDDVKLFLVMPFASNGNLRSYIKDNKLPNKEKINIAKGIANGIMTLHNNDIIHENINPENILVFDGTPKISNLPLPYKNKDLYFKNKELYFDGKLFDNIGYVDPNSFCNRNFKKDKPMDIYNFGTLLWEIMSEKIPYSKDHGNNISELILNIKNNDYREDPISEVPKEYTNLYSVCWKGNSLDRPKIKEVCEQLKKLS